MIVGGIGINFDGVVVGDRVVGQYTCIDEEGVRYCDGLVTYITIV